jgi:hypothetical protein
MFYIGVKIISFRLLFKGFDMLFSIGIGEFHLDYQRCWNLSYNIDKVETKFTRYQ